MAVVDLAKDPFARRIFDKNNYPKIRFRQCTRTKNAWRFRTQMFNPEWLTI